MVHANAPPPKNRQVSFVCIKIDVCIWVNIENSRTKRKFCRTENSEFVHYLAKNKANMYTITGKCIHVPSKAIASGRHTYPHLPVSIIGKCMPQRWKSTIEIGSVSPLAAHFPQNWPMVLAKPKIERGEFSNQLWFGLFCTKIEPNGPFDLQAIEFVGNVHGASYCLNLGNGLPERQTGALDANSPRQRI